MLKTATVALALVATDGCATRRENAALTGGAIGAAVGGGAGATIEALTH